jgi:chromosome segregation ATPase
MSFHSMSDLNQEDSEIDFDLEEKMVNELIARVGEKLEPFKKDNADMVRMIDGMNENFVGNEREVDYLNAELTDLREKASNLRRNIDETKIAQESARYSIENMTTMKGNMAVREALNREEIHVFEEKFDELKSVLNIGSGWTSG